MLGPSRYRTAMYTFTFRVEQVQPEANTPKPGATGSLFLPETPAKTGFLSGSGSLGDKLPPEAKLHAVGSFAGTLEPRSSWEEALESAFPEGFWATQHGPNSCAKDTDAEYYVLGTIKVGPHNRAVGADGTIHPMRFSWTLTKGDEIIASKAEIVRNLLWYQFPTVRPKQVLNRMTSMDPLGLHIFYREAAVPSDSQMDPGYFHLANEHGLTRMLNYREQTAPTGKESRSSVSAVVQIAPAITLKAIAKIMQELTPKGPATT